MNRRKFLSTVIVGTAAASLSLLAASSPIDGVETENDRSRERRLKAEEFERLLDEHERTMTAIKKRLGIPEGALPECHTNFDIMTYVNNRAVSQGLPEPYPWVFKPGLS